MIKVLDDDVDSMAMVSVYDTDLEKESKVPSRKSSLDKIDINKTHDLCQINIGGSTLFTVNDRIIRSILNWRY